MAQDGGVDIPEVTLGRTYTTVPHTAFQATLHVAQSGLLRVMSNGSDYPFPYADAEHTELLDFNSSFYDGAQGYVIKVTAGQVIYFYRDFCMGASRVWFEMQKESLTFTSSPAVGSRLLPTGRAQLELLFNMPVDCSGGTMTCQGNKVQLEARSGNLYFIYEIKDIIMRWIEAGIPAGTPIEVELHDVHATVSPDIKYGTNGTLRLRYAMPSEPGKLVSCNFEERIFRAYWLADDDEAIFRMTFTHPVSQTHPGYLSIIYGNAEAMDVANVVLDGYADGNDVVFDLRGRDFRPKTLLESGTTYPSIMLHPGGVYDSNGDLMYSPGIGTIASWTYDIPYLYLTGKPRWEITDENENDISRLNGGDRIMLYVYNYHVVRTDGVLFTFDDGEQCVVPIEDVEVEYEPNGTSAILLLTVPYSGVDHRQVTISFERLRILSGEDAPTLAETFEWSNDRPTGLTPIESALVGGQGVYDLSGRVYPEHLSKGIQGHTVRIKQGRKTL